MSYETILGQARQLWVLIGSMLMATGILEKAPLWVINLIGTDVGANLIFAALGGILALWQFIRQGNQEKELSKPTIQQHRSGLRYVINPFAKAA